MARKRKEHVKVWYVNINGDNQKWEGWLTFIGQRTIKVLELAWKALGIPFRRIISIDSNGPSEDVYDEGTNMHRIKNPTAQTPFGARFMNVFADHGEVVSVNYFREENDTPLKTFNNLAAVMEKSTYKRITGVDLDEAKKKKTSSDKRHKAVGGEGSEKLPGPTTSKGELDFFKLHDVDDPARRDEAKPEYGTKGLDGKKAASKRVGHVKGKTFAESYLDQVEAEDTDDDEELVDWEELHKSLVSQGIETDQIRNIKGDLEVEDDEDFEDDDESFDFDEKERGGETFTDGEDEDGFSGEFGDEEADDEDGFDFEEKDRQGDTYADGKGQNMGSMRRGSGEEQEQPMPRMGRRQR